MKKAPRRWGWRMIRKLIREQNGECPLCGQFLPAPKADCAPDDRPTVDHIIPLAKGGPDYLWNLQIVHHRCNQEKADRAPTFHEVQRALVFGSDD